MPKLYRPDSPARGEPAEVRFTPTAAQVHLDGTTLELPWTRVHMRQEGFENAFFVLKDGDVEVWVEHARMADLVALREQLPPSFAGQLTQVAASDTQTRSLAAVARWAGVASLVGMCLFVCSGGLASVVVAMTPLSVDTTIGSVAHEALSGVPCGSAGPTKEVQAMVDRLAAQLDDNPFEWHAQVVANPEPNAFALPGGYITVHSGLIDILDSPDALAGVLGHEITHATERHGLERMVHEMSIPILIPLLFGDASFAVEAAVSIAATAQSLSYSRGQESESDARGQELAALAGYDPAATADAFDAIAEYQGDLGAALSVLSTHPDSRARADEMRARAADLPRGAAVPPIDMHRLRDGCSVQETEE